MQKRSALSHFTNRLVSEPVLQPTENSRERKRESLRQLSTVESLKPGAVQAFLLVCRWRTVGARAQKPREPLGRRGVATVPHQVELSSAFGAFADCCVATDLCVGYFVENLTGRSRSLPLCFTSAACSSQRAG